MLKRIVLLVSFSICYVTPHADEVATSFMLMNNYNARQLVDIWSRMRAGFKMSHKETSRVKYYERLYTKNPKAFTKRLAASKPYLYYILNETERFGIPSEVALLAGVESFYDPYARSKSNAYGMWQFLPGTGRRFNLAQTSDIDERQDIVKSTDAALMYLTYLYSLFGQWEVAIGAYNSGEGAMYRVVRDSGQKRGKVGYDDLNLREETQNYVPKLIALANIIESPKRFGVTLDEVPNEPYFAMTSPVVETNLGTVAKLSGVDSKTFAKLNPQYKSDSYRLSQKHKVLLPVTNQNIYYASVGKAVTAQNSNNLQMASNQSAVAEPDASNITQASLDVTDADDINDILDQQPAATNSMQANSAATPGAMENRAQLDELINNLSTDGVPKKYDTVMASGSATTVTGASASASASASDKDTTVKYTVGQGDTLYSIAKKHNANIDDIRTDNKIPRSNLSSGQVLQIRQNGMATTPKTSS